MKNECKLCPFRKQTKMTNYNYNSFGGAPVNTVYEEDFLECLKEKCLAWHELKNDCRLMEK